MLIKKGCILNIYNMEKLSREEIQKIESFLLNLNIKFIDVRLELTDHLATEFEQNSEYVLLEDFLKTKVNFIKDFETKRQKSIHWSYQRLLLKQLSKFFYVPKLLFFNVLIFLIVYGFVNISQLKNGYVTILLSIFTINIIGFAKRAYNEKEFKKLQIAQPLYSIMALPSLFLYFANLIKEPLLEQPIIFIVYFFIGLLINISGLMVLLRKKKDIQEYYKMIK